MTRTDMGQIVFSRSERARLAEVCQILGCTFGEFSKQAILQAVDEVEGRERSARVEGLWRRARATNGSSHAVSVHNGTTNRSE